MRALGYEIVWAFFAVLFLFLSIAFLTRLRISFFGITFHFDDTPLVRYAFIIWYTGMFLINLWLLYKRIPL